MNKCKCGEVSYSNIVFVTEMTFGHGDSTHVTFVRCRTCGNKTSEHGGWGWHDDKDIRKAQDEWNQINSPIKNKEQ